MRRSIRQFWSIAILLLIFSGFLCISASATENSEPLGGTLGASLAWEYDPATATLTVSGEGAIPNFSSLMPSEYVSGVNCPPWFNREGTWKTMKCVVIGEGVTMVGKCAFAACPLLEAVVLPNGLQTIGTDAFADSPRLRTVRFPAGLRTVAESAFRNCSSLEEALFSEGLTALGAEAFLGCSALEAVVLPDSLKTLERYTFYHCSSLKSVTVSRSLETIASRCFEGCAALEAINLPDTVNEIGNGAFAYCTSLSSFRIPVGVTVLRENVLRGCTSLEELTIPETLGELRTDTCLKTMQIPSTLRYIAIIPSTVEALILDPASAFYRMEDGCLIENGSDRILWGRYATKIPESAKSISQFAFANSETLREVVIPEGMTSLSFGFENCKNIETVVIHKNVTWIGFGAIRNTPSLKTVVIDPENEHYRAEGRTIILAKEYRKVFEHVEGDQTIVTEIRFPADSLISYNTSDPFPEGVKGILSICGADEEYRVPDGVEYLLSNCFHMENLRSLTLPKSIIEIGSGVFQYSPNLTDIYYEGTEEEFLQIMPDTSGMSDTTEAIWKSLRIHYLGDVKDPLPSDTRGQEPKDTDVASPEGCGSVIAMPVWSVVVLASAVTALSIRKRPSKK